MAAITSRTAAIATSQNTCDVTTTVGSGEGIVALVGFYNGNSGPGDNWDAQWNGGGFVAADATRVSGDNSGLMALFAFPAPAAGNFVFQARTDAAASGSTHIHSVVWVVSAFDAAQMIKTSSVASIGGNNGGGSQNLDVTTGVAAAAGDIAFWGAVVRCATFSTFAFNGANAHDTEYVANATNWDNASNVFWGGVATKAGAGSTLTLGATGDSLPYAALAFVLKTSGAAGVPKHADYYRRRRA